MTDFVSAHFVTVLFVSAISKLQSSSQKDFIVPSLTCSDLWKKAA